MNTPTKPACALAIGAVVLSLSACGDGGAVDHTDEIEAAQATAERALARAEEAADTAERAETAAEEAQNAAEAAQNSADEKVDEDGARDAARSVLNDHEMFRH